MVCDPVRALVRLLCSGRGRGQEWQSDRIHRIKRKSTGNHLHYEVRKYGRPVRPYIRKEEDYENTGLHGKITDTDPSAEKEHTGSAAKIAKEMGVHRNTIINYFLELRAMGAEIEYDNERNTYYFKKSFDIQLKIKI